MRLLNPVNRRSGVAASVINRNRNAQIPVRSRISSNGFALRLPVNVSNRSQPIGTELARKTAGLRIHQRLNLDINLGCALRLRLRPTGLARRARLRSALQKFLRRSIPEYIDATWSVYP